MYFFKIATFLALILTSSEIVDAGDQWVDSAWKCYTASGYNTAAEVTKAETVPLEIFSNNPPDPKFKANPGETPAKFSGMGLSPGMSVTGEVVTTYEGHAINCFTCRHKLDEGEPAWTFDWAVLAAGVSADKGPKRVRVFFVMPGDCVRNLETTPVSTGKHSPGIEIGEDMDGNGAEEGTWTLELTKTGPWLVENTGSGRKEVTMIFHYDKTGKVIKVEKEREY